MGDRDWRSERDPRADRYGNDSDTNNNSSPSAVDVSGGGGGGRYSRALHRRDGHNESHGSRCRSTSRERANNSVTGDVVRGNDDYYSDDFLYRPQQRSRFDGGYGNNAWQHQQQQQPLMPGSDFGNSGDGFGYGMQPNMNYSSSGGHPFYGMMPLPQQPMAFGAPGFATNMSGSNNSPSSGMDTADLLQFLLQQQQQSDPSGHHSPLPGAFNSNTNSSNNEDPNVVRVPNSAPAASRVLPSVDEFVPVVPKSLLNLVRGGPSTASPKPEGNEGDVTNHNINNVNNPEDGQAGVPISLSSAVGGGGSAIVLLEAPKIAPEADRRAREQRRAHISGFPSNTTRDALEHYFRLLLPEVRRLKTEREIRQLAEETGLLQEEGEEAIRHIPPNANLSNVDDIKELTLSQGKTKPFSFIELRLADMIDELIEQCQADPQRFLFTTAEGYVYPLMIRRPRDTVPLTGVEESKVVLIGIPPSVPTDAVKGIFENSGELLAFEFRNGYAYGEFAELRAATEFRADVHGYVFGNTMTVALPLYDWLKVLLVREGLDIAIADDDPVSGSYVMKQVRERMPGDITSNGRANASAVGSSGAGVEGGSRGGAAKSTALVLAEDPVAASLQIMRELLDMSFTLPDMLVRFAALHPHLRPLYANTQVTVYPTPILVLLNLFDEEELVHDAAYSCLLADIEEEVEKYGRVRQLIVPRREARPKLPEAPKPGVDFGEDDTAAKEAAMAAYNEAKKNFGAVLGRYMNRQTHPVWGGYGRVFVEYETVDEAAEAQQQIAGKLFGGRTVVTSFLYPDLLREEEEEMAEEAPHKDEGSHPDDSADASTAAEPGEKETGVAPQKEGNSGDEDEGVAVPAALEHTEDID